MLSGKNVFVLGLILGLTAAPQYTFAKNGVKPSSTPTASNEVENEKEVEKEANETEKAASKATKDADKLAKKAAQEAAKAAKVPQKASTSTSTAQSRIELLAKMKQAEASNSTNVDVSENEASLKYRVKSGVHRLTAEIEGFSDGDIFSMYVVIAGQEILVSKMELVSNGTLPAQEVEFDDATWPTNLPLVLSAGMVVRVRDSQGAVVLEGALASK